MAAKNNPMKTVSSAQIEEAIAATQFHFPTAFPSRDAANHFLHQIILPPSRRWGFISTGKNASSSTLRFLFKAEFGIDLKVNFVSSDDINPSAVVHQLSEYGVFTRAKYLGLTAMDIREDETLERLCIVRNPYERALSAFTYFCKSNEAAKLWFLPERLRINAFGFDWDTMPNTQKGFECFLDFVSFQIERFGVDTIDGHWRPQYAFIQPEIFQPTLTGRMEDLSTFYETLAQKLDCAELIEPERENVQKSQAHELLETPSVRKRIETVYADDFEHFGY